MSVDEETARARGLAARFAEERLRAERAREAHRVIDDGKSRETLDVMDQALDELHSLLGPCPPPLDTDELETLLARVRQHMHVALVLHVAMVGDYNPDEDPMDVDEMKPGLARSLRHELGIDQEAAEAICEAAGWPS